MLFPRKSLSTSSEWDYFIGIWSFASADGVGRGLGDNYVVRMDELVSPLDRHVLHIEKPPLFSRMIVRRRRKVESRSKRSPDGGRHHTNSINDQEAHVKMQTNQCGVQAIKDDPPLYNVLAYIRNGTCAKYGAFPWTVQIQVNLSTISILKEKVVNDWCLEFSSQD